MNFVEVELKEENTAGLFLLIIMEKDELKAHRQKLQSEQEIFFYTK